MVDVITKKQNGVVFTPEWVVAFMVEEVFRGRSITGNEKILDAGCGDGIFAALATRVFSDLSGKSVKDVIENNIYFIDVSAEYVEKTKERLRSLSKETVKKFNAVVGDFCFHDFHNHFDLIIGNPPYVRIQNLNDRRELLQKRYISTSNGSIDLYFCFFERALQLLSNNGAISFITPNSHIYSAAGRHLRMILLPHVTKIINFDHFQIFKDATAYTAITFLQKQKTRDFLYANHHAENLGNIKYKKILSENMRTLRWEFFDEEHVAKITHLSGMYSTLHDVADIHYGIATLKDDIYIFSPDKTDSEYFYRADFKIERDLCVPIIKASTYKGKNQDLFLIFPYRNERIIPENIFRKEFPEAYLYFNHHRSVLESRDKGGGKEYEEFYAFGRSQGLRTSFGRKILTSTMNKEPRFYIIEDSKMSFYAGYCIKPKNGLDIYELCDTLNSNAMKEYIEAVSKSYRGGYKSYAKSFLKDFIHPQFRKTQEVLFR